MPIAIIVAVATGCIVMAVMTVAGQSDRAAVDYEGRLLGTALGERRAQMRLETEHLASSNLAAERLWRHFDPNGAQLYFGPRLRALHQYEFVLMLDSSNRIVFASDGRRSLDPETFTNGLDDLSTLVGAVRGQHHPQPGELEEAVFDPVTRVRRPARAARFQTFAGAPALVAAVPVTADDAETGPSGEPPIVVAVIGLPALLRDTAAKLSLDDLHEIMPGSGWSGHALNLLDGTGRPIARLGWTPRQPGATVIQNVVPFLAIASGCFILLAGFVLRYMRRTAATIAAGEDLLRHQALHDPLSGLPNRTYFGERLAEQIEEVRRTGGLAAVLSIDLDRFKDVNDTLGHLVGDALIRAVALRLVHVLRSEDMVARLGGDEFAVISPRITDQSLLKQVADRIIETLRAPYQIMGHTLVTGGSIGIALIGPHSGEAADIMRCADVALYRAKNDGRSRACIYDAAMDADLRERKQIENDLRDAIEHSALTLAFQPIVNPSGERTVGVEALCRWNHPERGEIVPSVFVPIAEHSELIVPLGEWVLREACRQAAAWPELFIAVNVSPLQFRRPNFVEVVERILAETGFPGSRLELELTESTLIGNVEDAEAAMRRLKSLGVRLALDDFGTGYSSLLYLRTFPFDKLKIDRSFVGNIEGAADAGAIVHAIISLGRGLGMKVTAEGVETAEQHLFLRAAGVHSLQGYRFGRPAGGAAITERLAQEPKIREVSKLRAAAG